MCVCFLASFDVFSLRSDKHVEIGKCGTVAVGNYTVEDKGYRYVEWWAEKMIVI